MLQTPTAEPVSGGMFFGCGERLRVQRTAACTAAAPGAGLQAMPRRGHAVCFPDERPSPATRTRHAGAPVTEGEPCMATPCLRERTVP